MKRINLVEDMYKPRLLEIEEQLKQEFYKGKRKDKRKLAKLYAEKNKLEKLI